MKLKVKALILGNNRSPMTISNTSMQLRVSNLILDHNKGPLTIRNSNTELRVRSLLQGHNPNPMTTNNTSIQLRVRRLIQDQNQNPITISNSSIKLRVGSLILGRNQDIRRSLWPKNPRMTTNDFNIGLKDVLAVENLNRRLGNHLKHLLQRISTDQCGKNKRKAAAKIGKDLSRQLQNPSLH